MADDTPGITGATSAHTPFMVDVDGPRLRVATDTIWAARGRLPDVAGTNVAEQRHRPKVFH